VPFLTVDEGLRFRNCVTKYSVWLPTLKSNLEDTSFEFNLKKLIGADKDPWAAKQKELLAKYAA
jgi:hypothetical protein